MNGAQIQRLISQGLGIAAKALGFDFLVYRSASLVDPLAAGTEIATIKASLTTGYAYSAAKKPSAPDWTLVCDMREMEAGDWLVGPSTCYIAKVQPLLPFKAVECNRVVSLARPNYEDGGAAGYEPKDAVFASALPVFMYPKKDRVSPSKAMHFPSDSAAAITEWTVYVNAWSIGDILPHDVLIDELGARYVIDIADLTDLGFMCVARLEKP